MSDTVEQLYAARDLLHSATHDAFQRSSPTQEGLLAASSALLQTVAALTQITTEFTRQVPIAEQHHEISHLQFRTADHHAANARTILQAAQGELQAVRTALSSHPR